MRSDLRQLLQRHRVLFVPGLSASRLFRPPSPAAPLPFPLRHPRLLLTYSGRSALYQAGRLLGLSGDDTVLCPAYNCGHEIEPFLRLQVPVRYYRVRRRLEVDFEDLERKMGEHSPRLLLVTHYFGFPQDLEPIRRLCDERRVVLLEQCAHSFLGRDLGRTGHLAVFSFQKTVPLPHGGALVVNDPSLEGCLPIVRDGLVRPSSLSTWSRTFDLWQRSLLIRSSSPARFLVSRLLLLLASPLIQVRRWVPGWPAGGSAADLDRRFDFEDRILTWDMSGVARRILGGMDFEAVISRRRANFQFLLESLRDLPGLDPVFSRLPAGVCPLAFPFLTSRAQDLVERLHGKGIGATHWWSPLHPAVPWGDFPESVSLKQNLVALPVHQDLEQGPLERMVEEVRHLVA